MHRRSFLLSLPPVLGALSVSARELPLWFRKGATQSPFRFVVLGDTGTGGEGQLAVARQMVSLHGDLPFSSALLLGDNVYPDGNLNGISEKFERPYAELIQRGVRFHAVLGNHDVKTGRSAQINYAPFNMSGRSYYSFSEANRLVEFFALDSNAMGPAQLDWLQTSLADSKATWKIAFLHHPPFSSGMKHGSSMSLRSALEPIFVRYGVAAVFSGHDHVYERTKPQSGVQYFVSGTGGQVRHGGLDRSSPLFEAGDDRVPSFMYLELTENRLQFRAVGADGQALDKGAIDIDNIGARKELN